MPKSKTKDSPNKLLHSDIVKFSVVPILGALVMETEEGTIDMAINRTVAEQLLAELEQFLNGETQMY
jgi:hypothetical protein